VGILAQSIINIHIKASTLAKLRFGSERTLSLQEDRFHIESYW
ncbi:uncharacterized protein METZ01_LOCUS244253, partial [marine metagenome]